MPVPSPSLWHHPVVNTRRQQALRGLADRILALRLGHPTRVGIDGHSAAGKTTLADVLHRGTIRDQAFMDSAEAAAERYRTCYIPGEQLYLAEARPAEHADIVIDNRNFDAPRIMRGLPNPGYDY